MPSPSQSPRDWLKSAAVLRAECLLQPSLPLFPEIRPCANPCREAFQRSGHKLNSLADRACKAIPILLLVVLGVSRAEAQQAAVKPAADFRTVVTPFVQRYCIECHGEKKQKGKLSLAGLTGDLSKPRELQIWQAAHEALEQREMPPSDADHQPAAAERAQVVKSIAAVMRAAGVAPDEGKWLAPIKGNYVDHRALFSGKATAGAAGTNPRLWRLTGQAYEDYFDKLIKRYKLNLRNYGEFKLTAPWNFTPERDFVDYASAHRVGEAEIEFLLRNASTIAGAMIKRHSVSHGSFGAYIKELATVIKAGGAATAEQADAALAPAFEGLFQRPPTAAEAGRYGAFFRDNVAKLGGPDAVGQLLTALLCNTELIHRVEIPAGPTNRLAPRDLARTIAFALTDDGPDTALATAAAQGKLATREEVAAQVKRMLDDATIAKPRVLRFFREYFAYASAPGVFKDEVTLFQELAVRGARGWNADFFVSDADRVVLAALAEDKEVLRSLLTTTKTHALTVDPLFQIHTKKDAYRQQKKTFEADEQTAMKIYGISIPTRPDWDPHRLYDLPPEHRLGLLTHPAWLVAQSGNFDNHAIHRGRWIREKLLGGKIPEVPITVNAMLPDERHRTLRDRMRVTREEYCWTCHKQMDPLGLPFEQFDHFGRFRTEEMVVDPEATSAKKNVNKDGVPRQTLRKPMALDTTGEVSGSIDPSLNGPVKDPFELIRRLAASEHVEQVFVRHAFRYFLGRNETLADGTALVAAHQAYRKNGGSMRALVTSLLSSDPFLLRTHPSEKPSP
jgi:hypothetical protein